ncbi:hypothetical protein GCM10010171_46390 [Actinokineospora fastidiosa]|uniref:Uncharacterized protein n=1 Tax=Actinokineospora fastidiosa TaxID=1816 RepID=A0A918GMT0_9PSEU|nr:hypothetical protein GCM10010171_46390 [Actinokineospora fastidiosa]
MVTSAGQEATRPTRHPTTRRATTPRDNPPRDNPPPDNPPRDNPPRDVADLRPPRLGRGAQTSRPHAAVGT